MNEASTSTVVVLTGLSCFTAFGADADEDAPEPTVGTGAGAGVPVLDGSAEAALEETWRSFPWISVIAAGKAENLASNASGIFFFTSAKSLSTAGVDGVESFQSYCVHE